MIIHAPSCSFRPLRQLASIGIVLLCSAAAVKARQGAVRMLYTTPNATFVEKPSGEVTVTINDASGSIAALQTSINNARAANPTNVVIIRLLAGAVYTVSNASLTLGSHECLVASGATIRAANA